MPFHLLPSNFLRAGVLLAALVIALATTEKAAAGCGDHVVILKAAGQAKADGSAEPTLPKPPCHGPHCSAAPSQPAAPPISTSVVISASAKEVFTPGGSPDDGDPPAKLRAFESLSARPIDRASSIFHPPRA